MKSVLGGNESGLIDPSGFVVKVVLSPLLEPLSNVNDGANGHAASRIHVGDLDRRPGQRHQQREGQEQRACPRRTEREAEEPGDDRDREEGAQVVGAVHVGNCTNAIAPATPIAIIAIPADSNNVGSATTSTSPAATNATHNARPAQPTSCPLSG